jgi:hypothetical protein
MWKFSKHILERMSERKILTEEILSIINLQANVLIIPSDKDDYVDLYFGKTNNKYILVVVNKFTENLITARQMRKNEIKVYNEEMKRE